MTISTDDRSMPKVAGFRRDFRPTPAFWLIVPSILFLALFFVFPLLKLVAISLPGGSMEYYNQIFSTPIFLRVIGETFRVSLIVTVVTVAVAYPYAYAMAHGGRSVLLVLTVALLIPFWVSLLLRSFSWIVLLQNTGLINDLLSAMGLIDRPIRLIRTPTGVIIGMVHILLPYAVLPLYTVMKKIDLRLMEASSICGASWLKGFLRIYLPLSLPGVMASAILAFTLALGFYITPALLGSPRDMMIAQMIAGQFNEQLNFGLGAALAVVLMVLTGIAFGLFGVVRAILLNRSLRGEA
ncbi:MULTISPECIES: ABC transporter permease [unclassified Rhizobium]|uniref:ABC transporter permease n=1 Tax=Rhizobium sp. PP-CC-3G-465 TaxID=2135648 RepID=UPI0010CF57A9|nr:putative spermidine/putrescine transport system permease protein [Rhizobium sp. PP-CC-2G-626]TCQ02797.1 putative spermidine/putrescine transport system permease protein [Rhizobium sp. PP-F2F-G36]TCQ15938.1 putative spermidine/putrescine transport system permease protein [Rhizobium sp. PP-CC-3G-465]